MIDFSPLRDKLADTLSRVMNIKSYIPIYHIKAPPRYTREVKPFHLSPPKLKAKTSAYKRGLK